MNSIEPIRLSLNDHKDLAKRIRNELRSLEFMIKKISGIYGPDSPPVKCAKRARRGLIDLANNLDQHLFKDFDGEYSEEKLNSIYKEVQCLF